MDLVGSHLFELQFLISCELFDMAHVYSFDTEGICLTANSRTAQCVQSDSGDIIGKNIHEFIPKQFINDLFRSNQKVLRYEKMMCGIEVMTDQDKNIVEFISIKLPFYGKCGELAGIHGISFQLNDLIKNPSSLMNTFERLALGLKDQNYLAKELTERQLLVLTYICKGYSCKQIGRELGISPRTVENHLSAIKKKLNCATKGQLVEKIDEFF